MNADQSCPLPATKRRKPEALSESDAAAIRANPPMILTLPAAAAFLCLSPRTVRDLVKLRRLPAINLSGRERGKLLFRRADIESVLSRLTRDAA